MIQVAWIRGKYLNNFEGQNYDFEEGEIEVTGFSSLTPIHINLPFPVVNLFSISDFEEFPYVRSIPFFRNAIRFISNRTLGDAQILYRLEEELSKKQFDIVHSADPHYYYSFQAARLRRAGKIKKLVITSWETIAHNNESTYAKAYIKKYVMQTADRFITYTDRARDTLISEGVPIGKISRVHLGVQLKRFHHPRHETPHPHELTILCVSRLVKEKGVIDLYHAFKKLRDTVKDTSLMLRIVGDGPLKRQLNDLIAIDNLKDIVKLDTRSYKEMFEVYGEGDIFVLPSISSKTWEEQLGMVIMEAMASGLPVVGSSSGAIPEVIGPAGIVYPEGDRDALYHALYELVTDDKLRLELSQKSLARSAQLFDSTKASLEIATIYQELVKSS